MKQTFKMNGGGGHTRLKNFKKEQNLKQSAQILTGGLKLKSAFTLAEVLITLAIIGVVAALTIPTLITNYQKHQYVTQLKKNYNVLSNGFRQIMAQDGVTNLGDTKLFGSINGNALSSGDQSEFVKEFSKYFKVIKWYRYAASDAEYRVKVPKVKFLNGSDYDNSGGTIISTSFYLADGSVLFISLQKTPYYESTNPNIAEGVKSDGGKLKRVYGEILVDVNGIKKPNMIGRDIFYFWVGSDGVIYPAGGKDHAIFMKNAMNTSGIGGYLWNIGGNGCLNTSNSKGFYCAARIIEEGWKMNY